MLSSLLPKFLRGTTAAQRAQADKAQLRRSWVNRFDQGRYRPGMYGLATGNVGVMGTDTFEGVYQRMHEHHPGSAFRANVTGRIQALEEFYEAHLPRMGKRGARTGMLVGTLVGSAVGIALSAASLGVGVPLVGVAVGLAGQMLGFLIGFAIEKTIQRRFAKKHPELIANMRQQAAILRDVILREAEQDLSYNPERDLRRVDFFLHNLAGSFGKNALAFVSGFCGESPRNLFEFVRDARSTAKQAAKHVERELPQSLRAGLDEKAEYAPRAFGPPQPPRRRRQSVPMARTQAPLRQPID